MTVLRDQLQQLMDGPHGASSVVKRRSPHSDGYAGTPGRGPAGETCRSCRHLYRHEVAKTYLKCDRIRWTNGAKTDIRAKSPACEHWEAKP